MLAGSYSRTTVFLLPLALISEFPRNIILWIWSDQLPPHLVTVSVAGHIQAGAAVWTLRTNLEFKGSKLIVTATQQVGTEPRKSLALGYSHPRSVDQSPFYSESLKSRNLGLVPSPELWGKLRECLFKEVMVNLKPLLFARG